ncbi:uncharacterized protein H6S33_003381 [Morchella sextelata]|uniref:uncharacterized protein n=1 Tax=Morchella sextelata TaxID=1174677 RepID=UPI001D03F001|nr:uncharacterized protein H6S33_003381 [Morchella sextelata]KAH0606547.1 hypothetical protein H6S33_003381 [Morchella sextelata]
MPRWPKPGPDDASKLESSDDLRSKQGAALELQTGYNSNVIYGTGSGGGGGGGTDYEYSGGRGYASVNELKVPLFPQNAFINGVVGFVVEAMADRVVLVTEATHLIYKNAESVSITAVAGA